LRFAAFFAVLRFFAMVVWKLKLIGRPTHAKKILEIFTRECFCMYYRAQKYFVCEK